MKLSWIFYSIVGLLLAINLSAQVSNPTFSKQLGTDNEQLENCNCITMKPGFFGHQVFLDGQRLKKQQLLDLYQPMPSVLKEYKSGYKQRNLGNILLGVSTVGVLGASAGTSNETWDDFSSFRKGAIIGSFATLIGGAILASSGDKKVVWSYKDFAIDTKATDPTYAVWAENMFLPNRTRLKKKQVRGIMSDYPNALKKYNQSVTSRTIAGVGLGASFVGLGVLAATDDSNGDWSDLSTGHRVGIIASVAGLFGSIGFSIASTYQRDKSYLLMNDQCDCLVSNDRKSRVRPAYWSLGMSDDGVGVSYSF